MADAEHANRDCGVEQTVLMLNTLRKGRASGLALALLVSAVVVFGLATRGKVPSLNDFDQPFYIGPAYDLVTIGTFTDGFAYAVPQPNGERPAGTMFAPLYPALLAGFATADPRIKAGFACVVASAGKSSACGDPLKALRVLHYAMLTVFFGMLWWIAGEVGTLRPRALSRTKPARDDDLFAWLALAAGLVAAPRLVATAAFAMTETLTLVLLTASVLAAVVAVSRGSRVALGASGFFLAATALTRPSYLYLFAVVAVAGVMVALMRRDRRQMLPLALLFMAAGSATLAPWAARNARLETTPAIDYRAHTLAQRLAYNTMTGREFAQSFVCVLPGRSLGDIAFGKGACDRFDWSNPDGYYLQGQVLIRESVAAAGGWDHAFRYLVVQKIVAAPVWHLLVSVPVALSGAWIANWWGVICFFAAIRLTAQAAATRWLAYLIVAVPGWFMLAFHSAVAVNQDRYNFYLVVPYAIAAAWMIETVVQRYKTATARERSTGGQQSHPPERSA